MLGLCWYSILVKVYWDRIFLLGVSNLLLFQYFAHAPTSSFSSSSSQILQKGRLSTYRILFHHLFYIHSSLLLWLLTLLVLQFRIKLGRETIHPRRTLLFTSIDLKIHCLVYHFLPLQNFWLLGYHFLPLSTEFLSALLLFRLHLFSSVFLSKYCAWRSKAFFKIYKHKKCIPSRWKLSCRFVLKFIYPIYTFLRLQ